MDPISLWNFEPIAQVALLGVLIALGPLAWVRLRRSEAGLEARTRRLAALTLFLTFDLVLFGAYTRLSDSGLGCPDWPGCYGSASPLGARAEIQAAQDAQPSGPVTHRKAWIEMIHRYLASAVGVLCIVLALARTLAARRDPRLRRQASWAVFTLAWVILQGLFGAWTVTLKLYPAIVTLHLLGGLALLALLAVQVRLDLPALAASGVSSALGTALRLAVAGVLAVLVLQIALGGWVSTNYAVLACSDFPTCRGQWWPMMDFESGFRILRPLGQDGQGGWLGIEALTAIHMAHRLGALVVTAALLWLAWRLRVAAGSWPDAATHLRGWSRWLLLLLVWQVLSGLSNVVLGWPLLAALAHTGGAAALVVVLSHALTALRPEATVTARAWPLAGSRRVA